MKSKILRGVLAGTLFLGAMTAAMAQDPTPMTQEEEQIIIVVVPETEREMAMSLIRRIPPSDRSVMLQMFKEVKPELARAILHGLLEIDKAGLANPQADPGTTMSEQEAKDLLVAAVTPEEQAIINSSWDNLTTEHRTNLATLIRDAHYGGFAEMNPPMTPVETPTTPPAQTPVTGERTQPILVLPVPEAGREMFMSLSSELTPAEQRTHTSYLSKFQPDQALLIVQALHQINEWGKGAGDPQNIGPSMSKDEAKDLIVAALPSESQADFESLWAGMEFEQTFMLITLARDAYFGGFADTEMS